MTRSIDYFSSESLRKDLKGKTVRGGLWTLGSQGIIVGMQFIAIPILTRLLDATDFGLVAMVTVFTGISAMFVDAGLSMSTIQREKITHQQVSNLFWLAAGLGLSIALLIVASAPAIAWFYSEPRLMPITVALAITPLLAGLTIQHQALLRRAMRLQQISLIQILATLISYIIAIAVAWFYRSYWALVVLTISVAALRALGSWIACQWLPSFPKKGAGVRAMIGFGANLTGFNFVNYFARSGDNMLIGWWWGAEPLGFYERAYKLMMAPLQQINAPLSGVMIPALSRLVTQPEKYRAAYFQAVAVLQIVSCPAMAFVAVMAPQIVDVVFGPGFEQAGPILRWLAIAGFFQPLVSSLGWLYISQGRGRELVHWGFMSCFLILLSFAVGLPWGPLGVARAYAVILWVVISPLAFWYAGKSGPVSRIAFCKLVAQAIPSSATTVVIAYVVSTRIENLYSATVLLIGFVASFLGVIVGITTTKKGRLFISEAMSLVKIAFISAKKT